MTNNLPRRRRRIQDGQLYLCPDGAVNITDCEQPAGTDTPDGSGSSTAGSYNCTNDQYLQALAPGKYEGVTANYLSFNTDQATPHFRTRAELLEACTGGKINFAEAGDIAADPIADLGSSSSPIGKELHDAYLMIYSFTSEASNLGLLETLNDRISESTELLKYNDIYPKVQNMGEYRKDGKTNIDLLMADGDFFLPVVRIDLLERDGRPLPHTWEDLVELANFYNGTDLNEDGEEDFGFCIYPRTGSGFNDYWISELMYSTWATTDQTIGIQQSFFFNETSFEPNIKAGFENAMTIWKDLWGNTADGCTTPNMVAGRCAISFAPPGCMKSIFVGALDDDGNPIGGISRRNMSDWSVLTDDDGKPLWYPKMKNGDYAEPYRMKPFGSLQVVDRQSGEFVECDTMTCPKGEEILPNSELPEDDRANLLVESPHVGKIINRVPFYWSGGYGTGIRKSAEPKKKDLMWEFFSYVNSPYTSLDDVVQPSWLDEWRVSQMSVGDSEAKQRYIVAGYSETAWKEHATVMNWGLGNDVNSALTLRLPGVIGYSGDVVTREFQACIAGKISIEDMMSEVRSGWDDVTARQGGKLKQVQIYRASLGLDGLSEKQQCDFYRTEMDNKDPQICIKYDPVEKSSTVVLVAILVPVLFFVMAGVFIWVYKDRKRRHEDAIWKIDRDELKFDDPPEVAGRGTFGLVVKAEYRGTIVAVKRVIPPKEKNFRKNSVEDILDDSSLLSPDHLKAHTKSGRGGSRLNNSFTGSFYSVNQLDFDTTNKEANRRQSIDSSINSDEELGDLPKNLVTGGTPIKNSTSYKRNPSIDTGTIATIHSSVDLSSINGNGNLNSTNGDAFVKGNWKGLLGYKSVTGKTYEQLKQEFIVEMRILSKLRHPCITTVMGSVIDQKDEPMLVMEFMEYGSLYDLLHNDTIAVDGELIFPILQDIARGARFLHAADPKIIHGDLKAANVLVDGRFRAKIADFGLSAKKKVLGATGTPYWMAPELLRRESGNTAMSDVFSFGIILFELYSRKDPYYGENPAHVLDQIVDVKINKRPAVPEGCPTRIAEIMKECLEGNPDKRPTFEEIDKRVMRLDSENVEPENVHFGHRLKKKSSIINEQDLIHQVFPKHVAKALLEGRRLEPDRAEMATMFFSDIVGFTIISSKLSPEQVSDLLDRLYLKFDELSVKHDVFKLETIGDAFVGICNLVKDQSDDHAKRVVEFAMECVKAAAETPILCEDPSMGAVRIRVGIHCGPVVARVVGSRNPRYCVFGDTVNTTARMESHSLPMKIHCSDRAAQVLKAQAPGITLISRGLINIKGKGEMGTFFVSHDRYVVPDKEFLPQSIKPFTSNIVASTPLESSVPEKKENGNGQQSSSSDDGYEEFLRSLKA